MLSCWTQLIYSARERYHICAVQLVWEKGVEMFLVHAVLQVEYGNYSMSEVSWEKYNKLSIIILIQHECKNIQILHMIQFNTRNSISGIYHESNAT